MPEIAPLRAGDPRRLGPYRIIGVLGEGGQGSVYLGEETPEDGEAALGEGRRVAVKLLHARLTGDARARARFASELEVARRVAAFCTARVLDADVEGDRPYIVSEYIEGPPLSEVLSSAGPRSGPDLDRLAIGTMTALAAIHQAGIVHRDFKPANVLLAPDGPRVIDFGIARALDATGTLSSTAVGTPAYMAPEQISGAPIGPQADIWAWGATMVYAATARTAFGQDSIPAVMHRILNLPPDLGSLTEPLRGLVEACLNKQAAYRPSSQQVLTHLLSLAGSLPRVPDGGPGTQTPEARSAAMLNQGAEAASTHTVIRLTSPPPPVTPVPAPFPPPHVPQQQWGQAPTWPVPPPAAHPAGRRGIGVIAGAGSAAVIALILVTSVVIARLWDGEEGSSGTTGATGGELRMSLATVNAGSSLSPSGALYGTERLLAKQLYTGLVEVAPDGTFRNRLATRITPDPSCTTWRIDLRSGTRFSNGEQVTPDSFIRGWNRAARDQAGLAPLLIGGVRGFNEVQGGDSQTMTGLSGYGGGFQVSLTSPDCEFALRLGDPGLAPVPADAGAHDNAAYNDSPIGNGPFKLERYVKDQKVTLVRNDAWAFGKTKLDRVTIDLSADPTRTGTAGFKGNEYDWVPLDSQNLGAAKGEAEMAKRTLQGLTYLVPITARGPMKSKDARLAVSYALDRQALSNLVYGGVNPPATGIVPSSIRGFGSRGACPSCGGTDPERAKQHAVRAGLGSGTTIPLYTRNTPSQQRSAELVRDQLQRNLGWRVELKGTAAADFGAFTKEITSSGAEGLATFSWLPDYPSARAILHPLLGGDQVATATNGRLNLSGWRNARFDQLMSETPREPDEATRRKHLNEAEGIALNDLAIIPVTFTGTAVLRGDEFTGLQLDIDGHPTLATAALK